ncbi:hypothetical protein MMC13_007855 [Lambiella insularis]|nr:hypothetical protein [Lambiella insularis]
MNASCQCHRTTFLTPLPAPLALYICHCLDCRAQSSSAFGISARFPRFALPADAPVASFRRATKSGGFVDCYFCRHCGSRVLHVNSETEMVSVKGGCLEGLGVGELDLRRAVHIWCKRAVVEIPERVRRWEEGEGEGDEGE